MIIKEPIQVSIQQIANGYVVSAPDYEIAVTHQTQQRPAKTQFCADYDEVASYLKQYFPFIIKG